MRIAIDASRTTAGRITGTEHYSRRLTQALIDLNTDHDIHLYFRDPGLCLPQTREPTHTSFLFRVYGLMCVSRWRSAHCVLM